METSPTRGAVELSPNAITVLEKRYLLKDETGHPVEGPEDLFWRVASTVAAPDSKYGASEGAVTELAEAFYEVMAKRLFVPNSPTLMNAGRPLGQLSACFVLPVDDTLSNGHSGIYDTLRAMALVHQSGGGTGFSFSRLRAKNDIVRSTMGVASGPVSFMSLYDSSTDVVKQGGTRRGANMGILRVDHPDILDFIACKNDITKITNFNISVAVTDAFMEALAADAEYDLVDPRTQQVTGRQRAADIWKLIIHGAWKTGEPGVYFIDRANHYNPVPQLGSYEATNPCVTGDTLVYTAEGLYPIAELAERSDAKAVTLDARFSAGKFGPAGAPFSSGTKMVFKLCTVEGYEVRATGDHRFMTSRGWVAAQDLAQGDAIHLLNQKGGFGAEGTAAEGRVLGWLMADGHITGDNGHGAVLGFWGNDRDLAPAIADDVNAILGAEASTRQPVGVVDIASRHMATVSSMRLRDIVAARYGVTAETKTAGVPVAVLRSSEEHQRGFLQALFTADGHVAGTADKGVSVRLTSISLPLLRDAQRMLLNFGICSRIYAERHPARTVKFRGTAYPCQADHDLVVGRDNVVRFAEEIGFLGATKQNALHSRLGSYGARGPYRERFVARFESLEAVGEEPVFDLSEPLTHSFVANGFVVHNCGEQPLLPYDVCNLGSINLGEFVSESANIDWEHLRRVVHLTTHFLENVIDANHYPLPEITHLAQRIRRIGLGVMGLADLFVKVGVAYDSAEAVALGGQIQQFVDDEAKNESERIATLRGVFPEWERSIWGPDATCARDKDGSRIRPMRKLRNCNVTTVAPTGTISIIAGCSSGIEPFFAVAFMRNQAGVLMPDVNGDFVAIAKREGWYTEELMRRIAEQGHINFAEVPEQWQRVFVTANSIAPEWHIRMQAAFQEYNDSAISKTCNFANDATEEYVEEIYRLAYSLGCKGVTVYRDGSRDMQVLSTGSTAKKVVEQATASGKSEARADLAAMTTDANAPAEAAAGRVAAADHASNVAELEAEITRLRQMVHELESENLQRRQKRSRPELLRGSTRRIATPLGDLYVTITEDDKGQPFEVFMSLGKAGGALMADVEAIGRLISLALRSGISLSAIHRQLRGISSDRLIGLGPNKVLSVPDAVGIALEKYTADKQGVQQELLTQPGAMSSSSMSDVEAPPVMVTRDAEQMMMGGMQETLAGACPDCGSQLEYAEGCAKCHVCGYSECG